MGTDTLQLKPDRPQPQEYPHMPHDYRDTDKYFGVRMILLVSKADPDLTQDIAYIYCLHCNHFIILFNATAYDTTTINWCPITVGVSMMFWIVCWMHNQIQHSTGTLINCNYLTSSDFVVQTEMAAGDNYIDVGNILGKSWVCL